MRVPGRRKTDRLVWVALWINALFLLLNGVLCALNARSMSRFDRIMGVLEDVFVVPNKVHGGSNELVN